MLTKLYRVTKNLSIIALLILTQALRSLVFSQEVPHSIKNTGVYDFLDELANSRIIEINSAVKPFSRLFIAQKLQEADSNRVALNRRQVEELEFYLRDFGKETEWHKGARAQGRNGARAQG